MICQKQKKNFHQKDHHFVQCCLMLIDLKLLKLLRTGRIKCIENGFFHKLKNKEEKEEIEENSRYEEDDKEDKHCKRMPWYDKSDWVAPSATKEIEDFIEKVRIDLFGNQNKKTWVSDNLEKEERAALKNFRKWNREGSDKIIRIQDKSAQLVIDSKERIIQEMKRTLNDGKTLEKKKTIQRKII